MTEKLRATIAVLAISMFPAFACAAESLEEIRQALTQMRIEYENRIARLERRLDEAEVRVKKAEQDADDARTLAKETALAPQPKNPSRPSDFNPAIGAILVGSYSDIGLQEDNFSIPGFQLGGETGPGSDGLSIGETEINFNASVDDKFFGNLTFALADEDGELEVELEEAWIQALALPGGLNATAGRFFSGIGYLNSFHVHADDFVDRPLPYQAFLAGQYLDDGIQVRWLAPTTQFLEFGGEIMRGSRFPGGPESDGQDLFTVFAKTGGDIDLSHSWKAGVSYLSADVLGRGEPDSGVFNGESDLLGLEFVYKWAPNGNVAVRHFILQAEYFARDEKGSFRGVDYAGDQDGWYLQGTYQFRPGWRLGYRRDELSADNRGVAGTELDNIGFNPRRDSLMLEWFNSEFSRTRVQYIRDRSSLEDDNQLILQYVMSIGAHRAHQF